MISTSILISGCLLPALARCLTGLNDLLPTPSPTVPAEASPAALSGINCQRAIPPKRANYQFPGACPPFLPFSGLLGPLGNTF